MGEIEKGAARGVRPDIPTEIEVRLAVDVGSPEGACLWRGLRRRALLGEYRLGPPASRSVRDIYWDTSDRALGRALVALRVRQVPGQTPIITVKLPGSVTGCLTERPELERELTPASVAEFIDFLAPYLSASDPVAIAAALADGDACGPLEPILAAHTRRVTRPALFREAPRAKLVLDRVAYHAVRGAARFSRIAAPAEYIVEVEAAAPGGPADVLAIESHILALAAAAGPGGAAAARGEPRPKLERGLALAGDAAAATAASPPAARPGSAGTRSRPPWRQRE